MNNKPSTKNKVAAPVKKFKLSDLKPRSYTFELVHPEHGATGATMTIITMNSVVFFNKQLELNKKYANIEEKDIPLIEKMQSNAELYASVVTDWDADFFGNDFNTANIEAVLADVDNVWILNQLIAELGKKENFFTKI